MFPTNPTTGCDIDERDQFLHDGSQGNRREVPWSRDDRTLMLSGRAHHSQPMIVHRQTVAMPFGIAVSPVHRSLIPCLVSSVLDSAG